VRSALFVLASLAVAASAAAAEEAGGHAGIPWGEIFKQAVNFSILVAVLVYFLRKPVGAYLSERSELLKKAIDEAARAREAAAEKLASIETRMEGLSREIEEMNRKMDLEADAEGERIRSAARAEIERLHAQVQFAADQELSKARAELRREAAELSSRAAEEIVRMAITPEDQERMARENIDRIREILR
jgi:F-type H+-transporting ATPase subunit b